MGPGELKAAADAGPLIHLHEIGCLGFLNRFDALHVPDAVWIETVTKGRISKADISSLLILQRHSLSESEVEQFVRQNGLSELHSGERECLFICLQKGISILLTDDMAVRDAAKRLRIVPVGSLGIVVSTFKEKQITLEEAEQHIYDLQDVSSLFVTRTIAELAIAQLRSLAR